MTILDLLENYSIIEEINSKYESRQKELEKINEKIKSIREESGDD